jgi:hypothetical protein
LVCRAAPVELIDIAPEPVRVAVRWTSLPDLMIVKAWSYFAPFRRVIDDFRQKI